MPLASSIASSSEATGTIGATGPKVSSRSRALSAAAPVTTAGERKWPRSWPPSSPPTRISAPPAPRRLELGDHLGPLRLGDHRADVGRDLEGVAEDEAAGVLDEGGDVVVEDLLGDVEALGRGADLAGVEEGGPGAAAGGDLELRRRRRRRR